MTASAQRLALLSASGEVRAAAVVLLSVGVAAVSYTAALLPKPTMSTKAVLPATSPEPGTSAVVSACVPSTR